MTYFLLFFISMLPFSFLVSAQDRSPHGLAYESPMVLSPSAIEFFHPKATSTTPNTLSPCADSNCVSYSSSNAVAQSNLAHESKFSTPNHDSSRVGIGGLVGIVFGFVLVVLVAMGIYYVAVTRRANANRANSVQPDV
ncbi:hypothetical protein ACHQM5_029915 [Ranunculus cassubicifolius]